MATTIKSKIKGMKLRAGVVHPADSLISGEREHERNRLLE